MVINGEGDNENSKELDGLGEIGEEEESGRLERVMNKGKIN
ncbi:hypothetical protein [Staphylococcus warneri]|nr:hypothetical protein [Staphylococcus warneri]